MAATTDEADEVRWRAVLETLGSGSVVEIPCQSERDFVRRTAQATKRAEKIGIAIEVERTASAIRLVPKETSQVVTPRGGERRESQSPRQRSRKAVVARR